MEPGCAKGLWNMNCRLPRNGYCTVKRDGGTYCQVPKSSSCGIKNFSIFLFPLLFFIRFCLGRSSKQRVLEYLNSSGSVKICIL